MMGKQLPRSERGTGRQEQTRGILHGSVHNECRAPSKLQDMYSIRHGAGAVSLTVHGDACRMSRR